MFSLASFTAGPAWEASGIVRCPMQYVNVHIEMFKLVYKYQEMLWEVYGIPT